MIIPKIHRSRGADKVKAVKIIVIAPKEEILGINKAISRILHKLAKTGYCKEGFEIVNGIEPDNN